MALGAASRFCLFGSALAQPCDYAEPCTCILVHLSKKQEKLMDWARMECLQPLSMCTPVVVHRLWVQLRSLPPPEQAQLSASKIGMNAPRRFVKAAASLVTLLPNRLLCLHLGKQTFKQARLAKSCAVASASLTVLSRSAASSATT
eukprot:1158404-Pelagomonas_calceolata.AAC.2